MTPRIGLLVARMACALLRISPQDVAPGFVDVRRANEVSITSNSAQGYALAFQTLAPLFSFRDNLPAPAQFAER